MDKLVKILRKHFDDRENFEIEDFIHAYGDPKQAFLMYRVFWPEFSLVSGKVVLKSKIDQDDEKEKLEKALSKLENPENEILSGYRWEEVPYLFQDTSTLSDSDDEHLAKLIAKTWAGALCIKFPSIKFKVTVLSPEETGSVVGVSFSEESLA